MAIITRPFKKESEKQIQYYSDLTTGFNIHPNRKDLSLFINEDAVKSSIRNILKTSRGERLFNPLYGCGLNNYLFEDISLFTQEQIRSEILSSIKEFEPRANVLDVVVTPYVDENAYVISIVFTTINIQTPITLELLVSRIR